jgi:exonuclease SbcC
LVPVKLELKNFMCYKDATLDLDTIHLACLSGDNGAGKSAILDALTWSLWGKARAAADELIAMGEIEMQATLEFYINEQLYRVKRYRTRKGAGQTVISFQIKSPNGDWRNISGNSQRGTQEEIIKALRMEYDTFINSAFLLQGRADEFMTRTPGERKKVLSDILGLSFYDDLETAAKEEVREAEQRRRRLDERLAELNQDLDLRPTYERQKEQAQAEYSESQLAFAKSETEFGDLQRREDELKTKDRQLNETRRTVEKDRLELAETVKSLRQTKDQIEVCQEYISRRDSIENGFKEFVTVDRELEILNQKFERFQQLINLRRSLQDTIKQTGMRLEAQQHQLNLSLKEVEELSQQLPRLEKVFETLKVETAAATEAQQKVDKLRTTVQEKKGENRFLGEQIKQSDKLLAEIKQRADHVPHVGEACETCGTQLTEEAREKTINDRRREFADQRKAGRELKERQDALQTELQTLEKDLRDLEKPAARMAELQRKSGSLERELLQARQASDKAADYREKLVETGQRLEKGEYCADERAKLIQVDRESKELAYDETARQSLRVKRDSLKQFEQQKTALVDAERRIVQLQESLERETLREGRLRRNLAENEVLIEKMVIEVAELPMLTARRLQASQRKDEADLKLKSSQRALWQAESNLKRCDELAEEKKIKLAALNEAANQKSVYGELAEAFGKKGLQALIIDTVLPELEDESNKLLAGMSDGRMSVRFETIRDSKKGDAIETLDLKISDEAGVRSYELFSGGEAFRVNFAVRVALSKLLARRSGAALKTLIIDEGFGSQDGSGRERLVDAIRSIEGDFERVLVITHIQELKDVFPVRIDITKTANGSQISVN